LPRIDLFAIVIAMKKEIHPNYFTEAKTTCACGHSFNFGGTMEKISVEICSNCHPFYTGNEKVLDAAGRVEKFKTRQAQGKTKTKKEAVEK
jgi:large subunit ribosomal protein L31